MLLAVVAGSWMAFGGSDTTEVEQPEGIGGELSEADRLAIQNAEDVDLLTDLPEGEETSDPEALASASARPTAQARPTASPSARRSDSGVTFRSTPVVQDTGAAQQAATQPTAAPQGGGSVTRDHRRRFDDIADNAESIARDVIRMERRDRPGSNASADEQQAFRTRQANAETARGYQNYLSDLRRYMRNVESGADAEMRIQQAEQTRGYLRNLQAGSSATLN